MVMPVLVAPLLVACGGEPQTSETLRNPDGKTFYCGECRIDAAWPPEGHIHGVTRYCGECEARVPVVGHVHKDNRWCDTCKVVATWVDDDRMDNWDLRGHIHGKTQWCPVCEMDVTLAGPGEPGGHHHRATLYCADTQCGIDVTRKWASDGTVPVEPAEPVENHVHGKTTFCEVCRREVEKDAATGHPSLNHFHHLTHYCVECGREAGIVGHRHGETRFCPVCLTEMAESPGVPTETFSFPTTIKSTARVMGEEGHAAATAQLGALQESTKNVLKVLEDTEAKLGIEEQPLVHDHSHEVPTVTGTMAAADPVSRFRNFQEGAPDRSAQEKARRIIDRVHRAEHPTLEDIARFAVDRLENLPTNPTEEEEAALEFWRAKLAELEGRVIEEEPEDTPEETPEEP
jgi:hypothetical protein